MFAGMVKQMLSERGVSVTGSTRVFDWHYRQAAPIDFAKLVEIAAIESPPMRDIVREMLKPSQNLFAQLLLLQAGIAQESGVRSQESASKGREADGAGNVFAKSSNASNSQTAASPTPDPHRTTERWGLDAMSLFLAQAGINKDGVLLEEGSGLSRKDLITPDATVALLRFMSRHTVAEDFRSALPVAGVDGTLKNRMRDTAAAGNVRAKTGSLRYVSTLSGYVTTAAGERLAFSILLNNYYNSDRSVSSRDDIDAIPIMLAEFNGKSH
jgi:D-alanyl-D-alanine carboxypeptidase/D-alanyl-D-alanine-endopeptidase (penicillin-binding protein 4)